MPGNPFDQFDAPAAPSAFGNRPVIVHHPQPSPQTPAQAEGDVLGNEKTRGEIAKTQQDVKQPQRDFLKSYTGASTTIDKQVARIDALLNDSALGNVIGPIEGRLPTSVNDAIAGVEGLFGGGVGLSDPERVQARIDQLGSAATIAELQDMRANSPTGGAVGQVSNYEDKMFRDAAARLRQSQSEGDFKQALKDYKDELLAGKRRLRMAYETDFGAPPPEIGDAPPNAGAKPATRHPTDIDALIKKYGG